MRRVLALAAALALAGWSPLEAEQRDVREGNEALLAGDAAAALRHYDAAERAAGAHPEIEYDRGNALYRAGRLTEARDAWRRALDRGAGTLSSRTLQNLGNGLAALGDRDGAQAAFAEALARDPANEEARYDLEVLLRQRGGKGAPRDPGQGGTSREPRPQPGAGDAQARQPQPDAPHRAPRAGGRPQAGRGTPERAASGDPGRQDATAPEQRGRAGSDGAADRDGARAAGDEGRSRPDGEQLLDALRARERMMPAFGARDAKARRSDAEKDW